ncbi:MAG TPA: SRPBCC family protein [Dehalococcoidia bacterium]|nr:SRPBCC family protein [Dehalococcoidia bacterium]
MTSSKPPTHDPKLDLVLERLIDVPRDLVWEAWTKPEHIVKWFTPAPWTTIDCEIDLRPGGIFRTTMRSPEGQEFPNVGCLLEVVPNERLVMTDALLPGYRPSENPFFTAVVTLESRGDSTLYTAVAIHRDEAGRKQHEEMGFHDGWGKALDQLVALVKTT